MAFTATERARLLAVKGVGPRVVERLEQTGFSSLAALAVADVDAVVREIAGHVGSTCWRNSPQARRAITDAIAAAACSVADDRGDFFE
jgi:predicted flap endonuclease-1-like 5' DNA nuclease